MAQAPLAPTRRAIRPALALMTSLLAALPATLLTAGCGDVCVLGVESPDAEYWKGYIADAGRVLSTPARMSGADWLRTVSFVGGIALLCSADAEVRDDVLSSRTVESDRLAELGELFGASAYVYPGLVLGYGIGAALRDEQLKEATLLGVEAVALSGVACGLLKSTFGRKRPEGSEGIDDWDGPGSGHHSMPSGHTTTAFALATAFHLEYRNRWVSAAAYSLATLTAWSRLNDDMHWASDVVAGAALGTFLTHAVFRSWTRRTW